jgi:phosphoglycerol transferase MdoB-like AlkP superfamily enzyme
MRSNGQAFHPIHLFPADLAAFVLFFKPAHERDFRKIAALLLGGKFLAFIACRQVR